MTLVKVQLNNLDNDQFGLKRFASAASDVRVPSAGLSSPLQAVGGSPWIRRLDIVVYPGISPLDAIYTSTLRQPEKARSDCG